MRALQAFWYFSREKKKPNVVFINYVSRQFRFYWYENLLQRKSLNSADLFRRSCADWLIGCKAFNTMDRSAVVCSSFGWPRRASGGGRISTRELSGRRCPTLPLRSTKTWRALLKHRAHKYYPFSWFVSELQTESAHRVEAPWSPTNIRLFWIFPTWTEELLSLSNVPAYSVGGK